MPSVSRTVRVVLQNIIESITLIFHAANTCVRARVRYLKKHLRKRVNGCVDTHNMYVISNQKKRKRRGNEFIVEAICLMRCQAFVHGLKYSLRYKQKLIFFFVTSIRMDGFRSHTFLFIWALLLFCWNLWKQKKTSKTCSIHMHSHNWNWVCRFESIIQFYTQKVNVIS